MQITVLGASGKVGILVVQEALRRGYQVVAFVHSHNPFDDDPLLRVVKGDVHSAADVARALEASEAVVSCLGSWGTPAKDVLTSAMQATIPAMYERKISRIVTLTGSGATAPGVKSGFVHAVLLKVPLFGAGKVFEDGEAHMRLLATSGLAWTTVRSPVMVDKGGEGYQLSMQPGSVFATIRRSAVAGAMLDQLQAEEYIGAAPIIHRTAKV